MNFIFVDDGSPDDSLLWLSKLQNLDSNIKVVELSGIMPSKAIYDRVATKHPVILSFD